VAITFDQFPRRCLFEAKLWRTSFRSTPLRRGVSRFDRHQWASSQLADRGLLAWALQLPPAGLGRHPEHVSALYFVGSFRLAPS